MDKVRSFNIPVENMAEASGFYREVFGWAIEPVGGSGGNFHSVRTAHADDDGEPIEKGVINGGLFIRGTHGLFITFLEVEVRSIEEAVKKVHQNGGKVILEKRAMLDFAYFAIIQDPDGNALGLIEYLDR